MKKVLKNNTETFKKLESISIFLDEIKAKIHMSTYNGILFKVDNQFWKYEQEEQYTDVVPPFFDGRYILCDHNGNTDFYN